MKNIQKRSIAIYSVAASILILPFIGMQFSNDVKWSATDFLIAGVLLFITAFGIDIILKNVKARGKQFLYIAVVLIILFLIWAELAVGIFGSPFAGS